MPRNKYQSIRSEKNTLNLFNISLLCFAFAVLSFFSFTQRGTDATFITDTTSYVMVDEIWNSSTGQFDGNNLTTLLQYITGNDDITSLDITSTGSLGDMLTTNTSYVSNGALSSADIRDIQLAAGNTYTNDSDEVVGQDVQVTFGGLTWQVVYLTQDTDENDIVTLWLSSSYQEKWANDELLTDEEGLYYGFVNGSLYSDWSADWVNDWTQDGSS